MLKLWNSKQEEPSVEPLKGALVNLWEKDPSVTQIGNNGLVQLFLDGTIQDGPNDKDITIKERPVVKKDSQGDFTLTVAQSESFDTVQTFAYVHRTLHMARRALASAGISDNFTWQWGDSPISVYPDKGEMENAYYDRQSQSLNFFHFASPKDGSTIYTCRAEDIVAHETGHAVLDGLCPGYMESYLPQTGAMHEAFGDITSMMLLLADSQTCNQVMLKSKGNLLQKDLYLSDLANQFGNAIGQHGGLRNANNELTLSQVGTEVHALSQVFSGAIYHILAFKTQCNFNPHKQSPSDTLHETAGQLYATLLKAFKAGPAKNASFADIANYMIQHESNPKVKKYIQNEFERRGVSLSYRADKVDIQEIEAADYSQCRQTLRQPHVSDLRRVALNDRRDEIKQANDRYSLNPTRLVY